MEAHFYNPTTRKKWILPVRRVETSDITTGDDSTRSISRRTFTKQLLASSAFPLAGSFSRGIHEDQAKDFTTPVPDAIAGYALTAEDKVLVRKYVVDHEKHLPSLRGIELSNGVPPATIFCTPSMNRRHGEPDDR